MSALAVLDRTLGDAADPASWDAVHRRVIGSYQAGAFAKPGSAETYVRQMLAPRDFKGNEATRSGNRWEPLLLAWAGAEPNSLCVHHPDEKQFGATVDGTAKNRITETKAKHNKVVTGPTPREIRQLAWQLFVLPEYEGADFVWGELVRAFGAEGWKLRRDPQTLHFDRDHPQIVAATNLIVPIAHDVLAGVNAALLERTPF